MCYNCGIGPSLVAGCIFPVALAAAAAAARWLKQKRGSASYVMRDWQDVL